MSDCHWTERKYLDFMGYKVRHNPGGAGGGIMGVVVVVFFFFFFFDVCVCS